MTPTQIQKLLELAEQCKTRDIAHYVSATNNIRKHEESFRTAQEELRSNHPSDATDLNAYSLWQRWAETEVKTLIRSGEALKLEVEKLRQAAVASAAKVQAFEMLLSKAKSEALQTHRRHAEQNGLPPDA